MHSRDNSIVFLGLLQVDVRALKEALWSALQSRQSSEGPPLECSFQVPIPQQPNASVGPLQIWRGRDTQHCADRVGTGSLLRFWRDGRLILQHFSLCRMSWRRRWWAPVKASSGIYLCMSASSACCTWQMSTRSASPEPHLLTPLPLG